MLTLSNGWNQAPVDTIITLSTLVISISNFRVQESPRDDVSVIVDLLLADACCITHNA
jgi:hypothetical protein